MVFMRNRIRNDKIGLIQSSYANCIHDATAFFIDQEGDDYSDQKSRRLYYSPELDFPQ